VTDDVDHAGLTQLALAWEVASVGMDVPVQQQAWTHPLDRPANRLKSVVRRIGAFVDAGRRPVGDEDIGVAEPEPQPPELQP